MEPHRHEQRGDGVIMGVMHAPRTRHSDPPRQRTLAEPAQPAEVDERDDPLLWDLFQELDFGEHTRIEFIEGTIVVRGTPALWHERAAGWLSDELKKPCRSHGWAKLTNSGISDLPSPARAIRPDLIVLADPDSLPEEEDSPSSHVLLVAEVVSKGSKEADRTLKALSCARADIPVYVCIDRFVTPLTVTVLSGPGPDGYQHRDSAPAGPGGGKLTIPEPFGIVLDLTTLPMPRSSEPVDG
jgi:Uma2 family endonuclease